MKKLLPICFFMFPTVVSAQISAGNSLDIPGTAQYISVPDPASGTISANMTIQAWVYYCCSNATNEATIIHKGWCGSTYGYFMDITDHLLRWTWQRSAGSCVNVSSYQATPTIPFNTWTHITMVHTAGSVNFYINGVPVTGSLVQGGYGNVFATGEPIRIGGYRRAAGDIVSPMMGRIEDLRIWNIVRTPAAIAGDYQSELTGAEPGLVAYYKFNESGTGAGITAVNSATATAGLYNGSTVGANISFKATGSTPVCYSGAPPASCVGVVPVALEQFSAVPVKEKVVLSWTVSGGENSTRFILERSRDARNFYEIHAMQAHANRGDYGYTDETPAAGKNYYRLTCAENSVRKIYSEVVLVNMNTGRPVTVYPVPAKDELNIIMQKQTGVMFSITGMDGRVLLTGKLAADQSQINISSLLNGSYILMLSDAGGYRYQQKFFVMH